MTATTSSAVDGAPAAAATPGSSPRLVIRAGAPSPEELAAVVAALAVLRPTAAAPVARRADGWASPERRLRTPHSPGPDGWRASARHR
ncbi:acyl-CoA carboxylase subunit epsilon [Streptomyces sp. NBC_01007]|nr:acyl-CoA carboxylase subunit epsilon [Streptomyces sp. NBC_01007]